MVYVNRIIVISTAVSIFRNPPSELKYPKLTKVVIKTVREPQGNKKLNQELNVRTGNQKVIIENSRTRGEKYRTFSSTSQIIRQSVSVAKHKLSCTEYRAINTPKVPNIATTKTTNFILIFYLVM